MPILQNATDFASGDQLTPGTLNALTESAKFVKNGAGVTNSGNTTDETSCNINSSGEIEVKDLGISTAKLAADCVTGAKIADDQIDSEHYVAASIDNEHLAPTSGTAAVAGSGTGATGTNVIEAASIGFADLNDDIISGQAELSAAPDDADEILISDAGTVKKLGIDNLMKHPAIPKAYGVVVWNSSTSISGAYNFGTPTAQTSPARIRVPFTNPMANTNYTVQVTFDDGTDASEDVGVYARDANYVEVYSDDAYSASSLLHVTVFGTLA